MVNKPRKLWMAGILSIIQPGLGHVYNGEIRKSLIIYLLPFLLLPLLIFGLYTRFAIYYLALFTLLIIVYYVLVIFDAVRIAKIPRYRLLRRLRAMSSKEAVSRSVE